MDQSKKKTYGIQPKPPRSREVINQEYNHHIASAGHKTTTVKLLEEEIVEHFEQAAALRKEAAKLPPEEVKESKAEAPTEAEPQTPSETQSLEP